VGKISIKDTIIFTIGIIGIIMFYTAVGKIDRWFKERKKSKKFNEDK